AEQRRHGRVAAQRGAVDLDEIARYLAASLLELEDAARELRFAGAGRAHQQQRILRADGDLLDALDQPIERRVARVDARFQERQAFPLLFLEARRDAVVAREIQVDDGVFAGAIFLAFARGRGLNQPRREVARLGEQVHADLRDVRAGRDVDQVFLALGI